MGTSHLERPARRMAELIDALIRERGLSQGQLLPLIGMQQPNISKLMKGDVKGLASAHIATAQSSLGLDPHYFFDPVLRGDGTYHAYLRRSDAEREASAPAPVAAANSNTAPLQTEDHETPAGAQRRREREASARLAEIRKKKAPGKLH